MLKEPTYTTDPQMSMINAMMAEGKPERELETGVIQIHHFNFEHSIRTKGKAWQQELKDDEGAYLNPYGVADNVEQIKAKYKDLVDRPDQFFCISVTPVIKAEQPEWGGWRWHKWGEYIGNKTPEHEYLYHEDDTINKVLVYHVYEIE